MKRIIQLIGIVYSWAATALFAGLVTAAIQNPSLLTFTGLIVGSGFMLPVKFIYFNFDSLLKEIEAQIQAEKYTVSLTSLMLIISYFSFSRGIIFPGSGLLNLSFHASAQIFMPVQNLFYSLAGEAFGSLSFNLGRWLLQLMYLYLLTGLVIDFKRKAKTLSE